MWNSLTSWHLVNGLSGLPQCSWSENDRAEFYNYDKLLHVLKTIMALCDLSFGTYHPGPFTQLNSWRTVNLPHYILTIIICIKLSLSSFYSLLSFFSQCILLLVHVQPVANIVISKMDNTVHHWNEIHNRHNQRYQDHNFLTYHYHYLYWIIM